MMESTGGAPNGYPTVIVMRSIFRLEVDEAKDFHFYFATVAVVFGSASVQANGIATGWVNRRIAGVASTRRVGVSLRFPQGLGEALGHRD